MSDERLKACLREALTALWAVAGAGATGDIMDVIETFNEEQEPKARYWVGYIQGVADGLDVTVLEMFDSLLKREEYER